MSEQKENNEVRNEGLALTNGEKAGAAGIVAGAVGLGIGLHWAYGKIKAKVAEKRAAKADKEGEGKIAEFKEKVKEKFGKKEKTEEE